jgi:hypothetical protein
MEFKQKCFMACNETTLKQGRCACYLESMDNLKDCYNCTDIPKNSTYHGITCKICNRPFRNVKNAL